MVVALLGDERFESPNETEISCGGRESAWPAAKVFEPSQKLNAKLPAVSFIDWLDVGVAKQ
jgi:hypothetical protein